MKLRIRQIREAAGLTIAQLATRVDKSPSYISMLERGAYGKRPSSDLMKAIAEALDVAPGALFSDSRPVPVVGRVGAGAEVELVDAYPKGAGLFHVAAPEDLPAAQIVAVEVVGDSMEPLIEEGDVIFFTRHFVGIDPAAIGHVSILGAEDGRALVKKIVPGREPGSFDLYSVNPNNPVEYGCRLLWAAPLRRYLRREDVEIIDLD